MADDLAPFAQMVVDQSRGVTVEDLAFASAQDYWSTGFIPLSTLTMLANSEVQLFSKNIGETGQGSAQALTISETNCVNGDRMPANQVYIGLRAGFHVYQVAAAALATTALDPFPILSPVGMTKIAQNIVWSLNIGDGIKRFIGNIDHYPSGSSFYASDFKFNAAGLALVASPFKGTRGVGYANNGAPFASELRSLPLPVIFPPNIKTDIRIKSGSAILLTADDITSSYAVAVKMTFRGYMMTLPA